MENSTILSINLHSNSLLLWIWSLQIILATSSLKYILTLECTNGIDIDIVQDALICIIYAMDKLMLIDYRCLRDSSTMTTKFDCWKSRSEIQKKLWNIWKHFQNNIMSLQSPAGLHTEGTFKEWKISKCSRMSWIKWNITQSHWRVLVLGLDSMLLWSIKSMP